MVCFGKPLTGDTCSVTVQNTLLQRIVGHVICSRCNRVAASLENEGIVIVTSNARLLTLFQILGVVAYCSCNDLFPTKGRQGQHSRGAAGRRTACLQRQQDHRTHCRGALLWLVLGSQA